MGKLAVVSSYESVWATDLSINLGSEVISLDLRHWVNKALMTFFFLVVEPRRGATRYRTPRAKPPGDPGRRGARRDDDADPDLLAFNGRVEGGQLEAMSADTLALGLLALVAPRGTAFASASSPWRWSTISSRCW